MNDSNHGTMAAQIDELLTVAAENVAERALLPSNERMTKRSQDADDDQNDAKKPKVMKIESVDSNALCSNERKRKKSQDSDPDHGSPKKPKVKKTQRATKITDLNVDCFGHIFDHLVFHDLLNVANLNDKAAEAAESIFIERHSNYDVTLCGEERFRSIRIEDNTKQITISTASQCAKVLRNFGDVIGKLKLLNFTRKVLADHRWDAVRQLINEKCTKRVTELELMNCDRELLADMKNVFECVGTLEITCSQLDEKFMDLGKWFPQLNHLELLHHENCGQIVCNYPHLSYLTMDTAHDVCLSTAYFKAMLKSTPKLQDLSLSGGMKSSLLAFVAEMLPNLKKLRLEDFHIENQTDAMIPFKNVETLSVSSGLLGDLPTKIPFEMDRLKELRVKTELLCNEWIDFAMQQTHLKKLQLISICEPKITDTKLNAMAKALPELIELDITADISTNGLKCILAECKSLEKIQIKMYGRNGEHLMASANSQWTAKQIGGGVSFQRKTNLYF